MTWSYSGDPSSSDRDQVRFLIGDTDTTDQQLSDEEIDFLITNEGNAVGGAVAAVRAILAKYARLTDKSVGDLRLSYSQRKGAYESLLRSLERRRALRKATPFAGGITKTDKDSQEDDTGRVTPAFKRDQFRYPASVYDPVEYDD